MTKAKTKEVDEKSIGHVIDIIEFMGKNKLAELELETGTLKLRLSKRIKSAQSHQVLQPDVAQPQLTSSISVAQKPQPTKPVIDDSHKICSPMSGTFYRAPSPNSEPFTKEGEQVKVGQTICIVEAMKMMNEIKSDSDGIVSKIPVDNGNLVDKGTVLFYITKS